MSEQKSKKYEKKDKYVLEDPDSDYDIEGIDEIEDCDLDIYHISTEDDREKFERNTRYQTLLESYNGSYRHGVDKAQTFKTFSHNLLDYKDEHNFIELEETIDTNALKYITDHPIEFGTRLRKAPESMDIKQKIHKDAFKQSSAYLNASRHGKVKVIYRQKNNVGRYSVPGGLSLQAIKSQIRQTIARDYYTDIDIANSGANMLRYLCDNNSIKCPLLAKYCDTREQFLEDLKIDVPTGSTVSAREIGKSIFIRIMNGAKFDFDKNNIRSRDLKDFYHTEVNRIFVGLKAAFGDTYARFTKKFGYSETSDKYLGKFMCALVYDLESRVLNVMYEFFGKPKDAVLVFDGVMVRNDIVPNVQESLRACERCVFERTGMQILITAKPFSYGFDLSRVILPKYEEPRLEYYEDFRHLIGKTIPQHTVEEWVGNSLRVIENGGSPIFITTSVFTDTKTNETRDVYNHKQISTVCYSLNVVCRILNQRYDYNRVKEELGKDKKTTFNRIDHPWAYKYLNKDYLNDYISNIMRMRHINSYSCIDFYPFLRRKGYPKMPDRFNMFSGFPMEDVELKVPTINFTESLLYKHIRDEMMTDGNPKEFEHYLDFIADIIQNPSEIRGTGHLFFTAQGMGKGMMITWLKRVIGKHLCLTIEDAEKYFKRTFNVEVTHKLLKVFEEVKDRGGTFNNHDLLKSELTKETERVEPKGVDSYEVNHYSRYMILTNNNRVLQVENSDRRMTMHRSNNRYANNQEYFAKLYAEILNEQFCRASFEFFATREYDPKNVRTCFDNSYKLEQKEACLPCGLKFVIEMCEARYKGLDINGNHVSSSSLIKRFNEWCASSRTASSESAFRTQIANIGLKGTVQARVPSGNVKCFLMPLDDMEKRFQDYLGNKQFKFNYDPDDNITDGAKCLAEVASLVANIPKDPFNNH